MSKKKAFGGSTMTLKDFHGGSIPSDLPLPSAPGVVVRSSEWSGYDRPNPWGGQMGRPDHRARPNSSPATRHFDDKTPFLSHTAHIGRHFDEDERKPLDGGSAPRRTISDESFRATPSRVELRPEPLTNGRVSGAPQAPRSYSGRVSEGAQFGANSVNVGGGGGSHPNVWAARKELAVGVSEPVQSKLANASALEKVSSGLWQSKHSIPHRVEVEAVEHLEFEKDVGSGRQDFYNENRAVAVAGGVYADAMLARHMDRGLALEDGIQSSRKDYVDHERIKSPVQSETLERPRVKLLPRTKPVEGLDGSVVDRKQGYQQLKNSLTSESHGNINAAKSSSVGLESENRVVERPKLNLKPRSQPIEQMVENKEKERVGLFGGARPREMVLKERGIDGAPITHHDFVQQHERAKHKDPKPERGPDHTNPSHHGQRTNNMPMDRRTGTTSERKDQRAENERIDKQRRNWRNDNRRNNSKDSERPPSPETWRKPAEPPKPASPDTGGRPHGKVASALELAQAFSKSFSDPKLAERGINGKPQVPFSRLTNPAPRPQINGY